MKNTFKKRSKSHGKSCSFTKPKKAKNKEKMNKRKTLKNSQSMWMNTGLRENKEKLRIENKQEILRLAQLYEYGKGIRNSF